MVSSETNGAVLRRLIAQWPGGGSPDVCEWSPLRETAARLGDRYHGLASVRVVASEHGAREAYHVCTACAQAERLLIRASVLAKMDATPPAKITAQLHG